MRYDKPDSNKGKIVQELQERGFIWIDVGGSVDGLVIGHSRLTNCTECLLVEIKNPDGRGMRFTKSERALQSQLFEKDFHGIYCVARNVTDILGWFGYI